MAVTARMSRRWLVRMLIVGTVFLGYACWCLYDARIGYPAFNERARAYNELLADGAEERWVDVAAAKGWSTEFDADDRVPDSGAVILKTQADIVTQYVMLALTLAIAIPVLLRLVIVRGRNMMADDEGLCTIEGERVPYEAIVAVDLKRWERKSIGVVRYEMDGRSGETVVDDWIYEGGEAILREIARRTGLGLVDSATDEDTGAGAAGTDGLRGQADGAAGPAVVPPGFDGGENETAAERS